MHRNARAVVEAGKVLGLDIHPRDFPDGTRSAADEAVVALVSGDNLLDEDKLAACAGGQRAWREDADTVREATGYPVGGVPPFGHREPLRIFIDEDLLEYDELWAAAGTPHTNFAVSPNELVRATGGVVCDLARRR
jgi:prolyl-tRNA editing enzyme YbaK/EbsC (Cys-tRNA(Pro) deacylase)